MPPVDTLLAGRYRIGAQVGAGGMGAVHRAVDTRLSREVAVKLLPASSLGDRAARERLVREALASAALRHPGIVHVYDVGETDDGGAYLVMELVVGASLRALVGNQGWGEQSRLTAIVEGARALGAAHRAGVIHRDVKPDNLMRRDDGRVVLLDFGIAKPTSEGLATGLTGAGVIVGTPAYLSPEQARGLVLDGRTDQFSLAVTAFELLTRALPWPSTSAMAVVSAILTDPPARLTMDDAGLADAVRPVLERAMAKSPADRFPDIDSFADALARAAGQSVTDGSARRVIASSGAPGSMTPDALARTELATPPPTGRRSHARWWLLPLALSVLSTTGIVTWRARRHPLDVLVPVVACPVLEGIEDGKPAAWLGAAAAYSLCDDLAPMLGGFDHHVRYPGTLLGMPAVSTSLGELDPWAAPDVRERSLAAARREAAPWVDGRIEARGEELTLTVTVRSAEGRELGQASSAGKRLDSIAKDVARALRGSGALGSLHKLDEDYAAFRGVRSMGDVDAVRDWDESRDDPEHDPSNGIAPTCGKAPPEQLPEVWRRVRAIFCAERRPDPSLPPGVWHPFLHEVPLDQEPWKGIIERELAARPSGEKRAELMLLRRFHGDDRTPVLVAAAASSPRFAWGTSGGEMWGSDALVGADGAAWAPDAFAWWMLLGTAVETTDPARSTTLMGRGFRLAPFSTLPSIGPLYARALIRSGKASEARVVSGRLGAMRSPAARDAGLVIWAQIEAANGAPGTSFDSLLRDLASTKGLFSNRMDNARIPSVRELAYVLGRERAAGDPFARAIGTGETAPNLTAGNVPGLGNIAALCALAEPALAKGCFAKLAELPPEARSTEGTALLDVAGRYVAGDFRGAAEKARPLVNSAWLVFRTSDFLVDVFDRGGLPEMAEELDRARIDDRDLHGASLATLRAARRAWKRGDKERARSLAKRCVDAWKLVDVTVPAVAEMEALLAPP